MDDLTDRERLALAFDDLAQRGYLAPIDYAWTVCCAACGYAAISEDARARDYDGFVFWHAGKDINCFYPGLGSLMPKVVEVALEQVPEVEWGRWLIDNLEFVHAVGLEERMSRYHTLLKPLMLHWSGDARVICDALRARGLKAQEPASADRCIGVYPQHQGG